MEKQYGVIPFIRDSGELKVVLVTSANGFWIFPKGRYEKELGKQGTAALEALEEAGVQGRLYKKNPYRTKVTIKSGERVRLTLYAMKVDKIQSEWQEDNRRKRVVVTIAKAKKMIDSEALKACLMQFDRDYGK